MESSSVTWDQSVTTAAAMPEDNQEDTEGGEQLYFSIISALIIIGVIGNALTLVTLSGRKLNHNSTSLYLAVLSISDTICIFVGVFTIDILSHNALLGTDIRNIHIAACYLFEYFYYWGPQMSAWCLVLGCNHSGTVGCHYFATQVSRSTPNFAKFSIHRKFIVEGRDAQGASRKMTPNIACVTMCIMVSQMREGCSVSNLTFNIPCIWNAGRCSRCE